jgi:PhzF family phenazine biosynthesis protein
MDIPFGHLDAFTERPFGGNPAAVCLLDSWLPDGTLQDIAAENNLSETAYLVPEGAGWEIRWFTPGAESISAATRRSREAVSSSTSSRRRPTGLPSAAGTAASCR